MGSGARGAGTRVNLKMVETVVGAWCDQVDPALLTGAQAAEAAERFAVLNRRTGGQAGRAGGSGRGVQRL